MGAVAVSLALKPIRAELRSLLGDAVRRAAARRSPLLVSATFPVPPVDPPTLFERARSVAAECHLWRSPAEGSVRIGIGAAAVLQIDAGEPFARLGRAWAAQRRGLHVASGGAGVSPIWLGGFAFDTGAGPRAADPDWAGFPAARLVLPRFLYTLRGAEAALTVTIRVRPDDDPDALAAGAAAQEAELCGGDGEAPSPAGSELAVEELDVGRWMRAVAALAGEVRAGRLEKAVLARRVRAVAGGPIPLGRVLQALGDAHPDCYLFAIRRGERCFLGATPERLVRVADRRVESMALAGSAATDPDPVRDREHARRLLLSRKDRDEHAVVVRTILEDLGALCTDLSAAGPSVLRLAHVQHLCTRITARLRPGASSLDLVGALPPTPAVAGRPRREACEQIRAAEPFRRGWYAGPVGWMGSGGGEFAVAIRSALVCGRQALLFAGCGIVGDSDPEIEYDESRLKLEAMLQALREAVT
ncbi:MAG TPA: isochorismate synthase [Limnochordia bacterium]